MRDERDLPEEIRERRKRAHEQRMQGLGERARPRPEVTSSAVIEGAKIAADDTLPQKTDDVVEYTVGPLRFPRRVN